MSSPVDYGVKVRLTAIVVVNGCHGCDVEGYVLSEPDFPWLMDVTLIAEPMRDKDGNIIPSDDVGEIVSETDRDPERAFFGRVLMREARKEENMAALRDKWADHVRDRKEGAKGDAMWSASKEARA